MTEKITIEADAEHVSADTVLLRAMLLRISDTPAHLVSVASSLLGCCLLVDIRQVLGAQAALQLAEQVLDKLAKDMREKMNDPASSIESVRVHVDKPS